MKFIDYKFFTNNNTNERFSLYKLRYLEILVYDLSILEKKLKLIISQNYIVWE